MASSWEYSVLVMPKSPRPVESLERNALGDDTKHSTYMYWLRTLTSEMSAFMEQLKSGFSFPIEIAFWSPPHDLMIALKRLTNVARCDVTTFQSNDPVTSPCSSVIWVRVLQTADTSIPFWRQRWNLKRDIEWSIIGRYLPTIFTKTTAFSGHDFTSVIVTARVPLSNADCTTEKCSTKKWN